MQKSELIRISMIATFIRINYIEYLKKCSKFSVTQRGYLTFKFKNCPFDKFSLVEIFAEDGMGELRKLYSNPNEKE